MVLSFPLVGLGGVFVIAGAIVMIIGTILLWLDK